MGGGLVGLERVSDFYMNSPNLRETVSNALTVIPDFWNIESNVRHYLTIGGIQNNILPMLDWAPGAFTNHAAEAGVLLAGASLAYLGAKKIIRNEEKKRGKTVDKFSLADFGDVVKNSPISSVLTGAGIVGHAVNLPSYIAAAVGSVYKTAEDTGAATVKKSKSRFSGIMSKLNDFYYNTDIL